MKKLLLAACTVVVLSLSTSVAKAQTEPSCYDTCFKIRDDPSCTGCHIRQDWWCGNCPTSGGNESATQLLKFTAVKVKMKDGSVMLIKADKANTPLPAGHAEEVRKALAKFGSCKGERAP